MSAIGYILLCRRMGTMLQCRPLTTFEEASMRLRTAVDFGAVIRDKRLRLGLSQADLARKVGVGRQWIVEVEKGKSGAPLALILRTLEALGISLSESEGDRAGKKAPSKARGINLDSILDNLRRKKS
ncbi:MAG: helix-turn-helix domain-containing protein [Candidatus Acidiferrales bacterium]